MRWARWSLVGLAALSMAIAVATAAVRSAIPLELSGQVTARAARADGPLAGEMAYFISVDGDETQVDRAVHDAVAVGDEVSKARWSSALRSPRGDVPLAMSRDVRGLAPLAVLVVALAALLVRRPRIGS